MSSICITANVASGCWTVQSMTVTNQTQGGSTVSSGSSVNPGDIINIAVALTKNAVTSPASSWEVLVNSVSKGGGVLSTSPSVTQVFGSATYTVLGTDTTLNICCNTTGSGACPI